MKTISSCFLYIAIMVPILVADFYFLLEGIGNGSWITIILMVFSLAVGIWSVRGVYKRAKTIEESIGKPEITINIHHIKQESKKRR